MTNDPAPVLAWLAGQRDAMVDLLQLLVDTGADSTVMKSALVFAAPQSLTPNWIHFAD
jgi:hypothetical protein